MNRVDEAIKALKLCADIGGDCRECYLPCQTGCAETLKFDAAELLEQSEIDKQILHNDIALKQKEIDQLKELLKLAVDELGILNDCDGCVNKDNCPFGADFNGYCAYWQWQHTDKLKELGVE